MSSGAIEVGLEQMVLDVVELSEPARRDLRQHFSLSGMPGDEDDVEGGKMRVGGDEEEAIAEVVDVAHLPRRRAGTGGRFR